MDLRKLAKGFVRLTMGVFVAGLLAMMFWVGATISWWIPVLTTWFCVFFVALIISDSDPYMGY